MFIELTKTSWNILAEFAPYLLIGFSIAGLLHYCIPPKFIIQQLGKSNIYSVFKAAILGIPLPLCSCSVIPVASSIRKIGASRGATISFLSSTPQTGVDSILATYGLFGWVFTVIKLTVALLCGLVSGILVDIFCKQKNTSSAELGDDASDHTPIKNKSISASLRYFFEELPLDLYKPLLIGIFIAGLINNFLPSDFFSGSYSSGLFAFIGITLISLPLYVCAIESLPLAFAFLSAGISPGAVLVFLIVGPASNSATILATLKIIGKKATVIYIITLVVIAWAAGYLTNLFLDIQMNNFKEHHAHLSIWHHISAGVLLAYFLNAVLLKSFFLQKKAKVSHCDMK
ncbi:MAG: permease [Coraliomargaritaceae bacterium]